MERPPEHRTYSGATREAAEQAYHRDAMPAAVYGYVPVDEQWTEALGQQQLTVTYRYAPDQAPEIVAMLEGLGIARTSGPVTPTAPVVDQPGTRGVGSQAPAPSAEPPSVPAGGGANAGPRGPLGSWWSRLSVRGKVGSIVVGLLVLAVAGSALAGGGASPQPTPTLAAAAPTTAPPSSPTSPPAALPSATAPPIVPTTPAAPALTSEDVAQVRAILTANLQHYETAFSAGRKAVGTKPYPDAVAGLAAFDDPNSNASLFSDWRTSSGIEQDVTYLAAFTQADAYYTADNEPDAIVNWRDDMGTASGDIDLWVQKAVSWQISEVSNATFAAATAQVISDFKTVQADIDAIRAP